MRGLSWLSLCAAVVLGLAPGLAWAQQDPGAAGGVVDSTGAVQELSLPEALARALEQSPAVRTARAQVQQAEAQARSAWSNALPQVNTQLAYSRALRSVYQNVSGLSIPDSMKFNPDPNATLPDRVAYLEDNSGLAAMGALVNLFSQMPFGAANTWVAGLTVTQPIFTGGRIRSGINLAGDAADAAHFGLDEARSDIVLQVKTAYYDAELAARSADIMQQSVELAQQHLAEVELRYEAGLASELDTLRAAVDLANLQPSLLQARNGRDVAMLNLKRLIRLPADAALQLTTVLTDRTRDGRSLVALALPGVEQAASALERRGSLRAAAKQVDMSRAQVSMARSAFLPTVALTGTMNRQAFPSTMRFPSGSDWRDDWSVGVAVQWPLFQGLKRSADLDAANAAVKQAQVQEDQVRDGLRIQYQQALGEFQRGKAQIEAAQRTVAQAQKVYDLTELRYGEGLATQLDVSSARLALQQARINRVQAYHDAYVALAQAERTLGVDPESTTLP